MTDDRNAGAGRENEPRQLSPSPTSKQIEQQSKPTGLFADKESDNLFENERSENSFENAAPEINIPPLDDMPLHIGDLLPGLRESMDSARMAYHHGGADGQDILQAQAEALDALFVKVLHRATYAVGISSGKPIENYLSQEYADLALRTQRHCRKTIETLTVLQERERQRLAEKRAKRLEEIEDGHTTLRHCEE